MTANGDRPRGERAHESTATDVARGVKGRRGPAVAVGLINERGHLVLWDDTSGPETVINREHAVTPPQPRNGRSCPSCSTAARSAEWVGRIDHAGNGGRPGYLGRAVGQMTRDGAEVVPARPA